MTTNRIAITRITHIQCITCGEEMSPLVDRCWSCYLEVTEDLTRETTSHANGVVYPTGGAQRGKAKPEWKMTTGGRASALPNDVAHQLTLVDGVFNSITQR